VERAYGAQIEAGTAEERDGECQKSFLKKYAGESRATSERFAGEVRDGLVAVGGRKGGCTVAGATQARRAGATGEALLQKVVATLCRCWPSGRWHHYHLWGSHKWRAVRTCITNINIIIRSSGRNNNNKYKIKKALTAPAVNAIFILQLLTMSASTGSLVRILLT